MPANFHWTVSSPIEVDDVGAAMKTFLGDINEILTPIIPLFVHTNRTGTTKLYNDDWGLLLSDDNFDASQMETWHAYMAESLSTKDWEHLVENRKALTVSNDVVARMIDLQLG